MIMKKRIGIGFVTTLLLFGVWILIQPTLLTPEGATRRASVWSLIQPELAGAGYTQNPDMPPFAEGSLTEGTYLELREQHVAQLRGLPHNLSYDPRVLAITEMQQQESVRTAGGPVWQPLGPAPIPNGQTTNIATPVSGRVSAVAVHPTDADVAYVGTAQGGLYRTLDGGTTWTPMMDDALSLVVGAVAIAPSDPSTIYVGTGEATFSCLSFFGVGLYRIEDADTATPVISGPFTMDGSNNNVLSGRAISKILVHPTDADTIFLGTTSGISGIGCSSSPIQPSRGLYRSTNALSGAPTFEKLDVATASGGNNNVTDIVFEPDDPDTMLVGVRATASPTGGGIYRTTDASAVTPTFTQQLMINNQRIEFAINKIGNDVTVIAATGESNGTLRRSNDGGVTWPDTLTAASGFCWFQCWYDIAVGIHPTDSDVIHVGGAANITNDPSRVMIRSTDGGVTFDRVDNGMHADTHAVTVAPSNPDIVYVGSDGGIWRSDDNGASYTSLNNEGFSATQFIGLALHGSHPNFMIGGTQDNGTQCLGTCGSNTDPNAWIRADFGDGGFAVIDQNATDTTNVTMYHTYFNQTGNFIGFARVTNSSDASEGMWDYFGCGGIPNGINCSDPVEFYAPMVHGPGNPNTLYFGTARLYRSDDMGETMVPVSQFFGLTVTAIGISPTDDDVRIVGTDAGFVYATTTGATTLTNVTAAGFPSGYVGRAIIDPHDSNTAYVAFAAYGIDAGENVWKTTDLAGGATAWQPIGNGVPDVPINSIVVHPELPDVVYIGTDIGVYVSEDGGVTWAPFGSGLPRVAVFGMAIQPGSNLLRIATHGRGIWEIVASDSVAVINQFSKQATAVSPITNNATLTYTLAVTNTGGVTGTATITDVFPAELATPTCVGSEAAAGFNGSGDLMTAVDLPPNDGTAVYHCTTMLADNLLDVALAASATEGLLNEQVMISITVQNNTSVTISNIIITNTHIDGSACSSDPHQPFDLGANGMMVFDCTVTLSESLTNQLTVDGEITIVNQAEAIGTRPLSASATVSAMLTAGDEVTITLLPRLYLPFLPRG